MSSRAYFTIKNSETGTDPKDVYQKTGDMLVEGYNAGYTTDMILDIISIPHRTAKMQQDGYGKSFVSYSYEHGKIPEFGTFEELLDMNESLGYYDLTWSDVLHLLHFTQFGKYMDIEPGVTRYGGAPVGWKDSEFTVALDDAERIDWVEIRDIDWGVAEDEYHEEHLKAQKLRLVEHIDRLNADITHEPFKITYKDGVIRFSITGIILNLLWERSKTK